MANDLKLQVLLNAIDKATGPLKRIAGGSTATAKALKAARDQAAQLNQQQRDISAYRLANIEIVKQSRAIRELNRKTSDHTELLDKQRTAHVNLKGNLKAAQAQYSKLSKALVNGKGDNAGFMRELEKAQIKLQASQQAFTRSSSSIKVYQDRLRAAKTQLGQLNTQHTASQSRLEQYKTRLDQAGIGTDGLSSKVRQLRTQQNLLNTSMDQQKSKLQALNKAQQNYQRNKQAAQTLATQGAAGLTGGGAALYGGARVLAPGLEFDASMSRVQAITRLDKNDPEKTAQLQALRDQARGLGGSTMFTAGQAADAQGFLGMAGFDPKAIKAAMPGMLDLAAAGGAELAQTADIASNIMSGLGMTADQMDRLGDVLVGTFTRSNTNLQMLGDTMKYAAPMAKTYGIELEVAAAMAGKLGDAGLQGSMGGTALSTIMNRLATPPKSAQKALEQLQIKTADANGNLRQMPDILKEIYDKTKDLGTANKGGLFKAIAGEEAVKGMAQLVEQAGIVELQKLIATLRETQGEAAKTSKVMADNLKGDLTTLSSAWQDLGIELEEQQDGPLRGLVQSVIDIVRSVKTWAKENPGLASGLVQTVAIVAGLTVTIGGLLVAVASVLLPFAALRLMFARMGVQLPSLIGLLWKLGKIVLPFVGKALLMIGRALMLNPIGLAMTALAGAAYLIYQNWDAVKLYFISAWAEIKVGFSSGIRGILTTLANFSPIGLIYQAFAGVLSYLGVDLPKRFTEFGNLIVNGLVNGLFAGMGQIKGAITSIGDSTIGWFKEKLDIHSPSRVFAELGGFTMAGLAQGLEAGQIDPLRTITRIGKQIASEGQRALGAMAGSLGAIGLPPMPIAATAFTTLSVDDRSPISPAPVSAYDSHDNYEINIHPTPGMDVQAIGRAVRAELTRIASEKSARNRSKLSDLE
jgi:TP901 family phage tail tape measure protein